MSEKLTVVTDHVKQLNRRTIATVLAVALVLSLFAGTGWFATTNAEDLKPEYPDLSKEETLEMLEYYDEDLTSLSQADVVYFTKNFLSVFEYSERALITDFLEGKGITYTLEYSDSKWKQVEEVLGLVQKKWKGFTDQIPTELKIDAWKTAEGNVNQIFNYVSVSLSFFKYLDYARNWDDNVFEETYHRLQAYREVVGVISGKIKEPITRFLVETIESTLTILADTYYIASYLHECYKEESLELYKAECEIAYYAHSEFPEPVGAEEDEIKGKSTIYMEYQMRRMFENYKNSTTVGEAGEISHFAGHSYQMIYDKKKWHDAKAYCESKGGHLVSITSKEENEFVRQISGGNIALGFSDAANEGVWQWVTEETVSFLNWCAGEPNNQIGEHYALMYSNGTWNDGHLERENWAFVCEWDEYIEAYPTINDEHHYVEYVKEFCEEGGYTEHICEDCGLKYYSSYTEPIGHNYVYSKTVQPTCTAQGYDIYTCTHCNKTEKRNTVSAPGHSYEFAKKVNPTCTAQGYDLYTCSVCGATERRNAVKALGHTTTYVKTVAPTCTAQGYDECLCSVCGATVKENLVKATGHDNEVVKVVEATCTDNGYTEYKCKTCGTVTKGNNVNAIGHNYTSVRTVNPTCTESGLDTFTCANCGDEYTKEVSALGHNFTWSSNTHFAPTCMSDGYTLQTCSRCSEQQKVNELPATGHDYGDLIGQDYVAAIYNSNKQFVDTMPYTPNSVTKSTIGSTAIGDTEMLLRAGWMTLPREIRLDAKDIKAIEDYSISRQRHPLAFSATVDITAMFAFDGSTGRTPEESALPYTDENGNLYELKDGSMVVCLSKESAQNEEILNADGTVNVKTAIEKGYNLAYSAGLTGTYVDLPDLEWVSGLSGWNTPTDVFHYDGQGKVPTGVYKVDYCFYNESQSGLASTTIKVYDKDSLNFKTAATEETPSQIHHKCIDCGEELLEDIASDSELKIKSASLSLGNNLSMNFKVEKAVLDRFEEPYLEVERNGKLRTVDTYKEDGDYIIFTFNNIAPQTLGDVATATLYAKKDGTLYGSKSVSLSIKDYAYRMLEMYGSEENAKLRTLMVDLLNYGSSAQTYHNYKANDLVNADLTDVQKVWASAKAAEWNSIIDTKYETVTEPIATWKSAALILDNAVTIRYKFAADDISGFTIKLKYGTIEKNYDQRDITDNGDGTYSFKFSGLYAHQMREPVYITIYKNGNAVSNTLRYSVESYAAQVVASTPDSPLRALTDSMMLYGISAANYA